MHGLAGTQDLDLENFAPRSRHSNMVCTECWEELRGWVSMEAPWGMSAQGWTQQRVCAGEGAMSEKDVQVRATLPFQPELTAHKNLLMEALCQENAPPPGRHLGLPLKYPHTGGHCHSLSSSPTPGDGSRPSVLAHPP